MKVWNFWCGTCNTQFIYQTKKWALLRFNRCRKAGHNCGISEDE